MLRNYNGSDKELLLKEAKTIINNLIVFQRVAIIDNNEDNLAVYKNKYKYNNSVYIYSLDKFLEEEIVPFIIEADKDLYFSDIYDKAIYLLQFNNRTKKHLPVRFKDVFINIKPNNMDESMILSLLKNLFNSTK